MVERRHFLIGFACAALVSLSAFVARTFDAMAAVAARLWEDIPFLAAEAAQHIERFVALIVGTLTDLRLLPATRSHGGVGLEHQHNVNRDFGACPQAALA